MRHGGKVSHDLLPLKNPSRKRKADDTLHSEKISKICIPDRPRYPANESYRRADSIANVVGVRNEDLRLILSRTKSARKAMEEKVS